MTKYIADTFITHFHTYVAFIIGLFLAISRWKKHPYVSVLTAISIGLSVLILYTRQYIDAATQYYVTENVSVEWPLVIYKIFPYLDTAIWICLLISIFGWRPTFETVEGK